MSYIKIHTFSDKNSLEMHLLKEIDLNFDKQAEASEIRKKLMVINKLNSLFGRSYEPQIKIVKVMISLENNKVIAFDGAQFFVFENIFDLKLNDYIYMDRDGSYIFRVDEKLLDESYMQQIITSFPRDIKNYFDSLLDWDADIELPNILNSDWLSEYIAARMIEYKEKKEEEAEIEIRTKAEKTEDPYDIWEKEGRFKNNSIEINKGTIKSLSDGALVTLKDRTGKVRLQDFIDYHDLEPYQRYYGRRENFDFKVHIVDNFISQGIDFKYEKLTKVMDVHFEKYNNTINSVKVCRDKMLFIISSLYKTPTQLSNEEILVLNKLPQIKTQMLTLKEVKFHRESDGAVYLPINFTTINGVVFNIDFLGVEGSISWDKIKEIFYGNESRGLPETYIYNKQLFALSTILGLNKGQVFDYLRKVVMLQQLSKEEEKDDDE